MLLFLDILRRLPLHFVWVVTAAGRAKLKTMPMSKLRNYINAYNIKTVDRIVEKDDLIDAILRVRVSCCDTYPETPLMSDLVGT